MNPHTSWQDIIDEARKANHTQYRNRPALAVGKDGRSKTIGNDIVRIFRNGVANGDSVPLNTTSNNDEQEWDDPSEKRYTLKDLSDAYDQGYTNGYEQATEDTPAEETTKLGNTRDRGNPYLDPMKISATGYYEFPVRDTTTEQLEKLIKTIDEKQTEQ